MQFIPFIQKAKKAHRYLGYIYVVSVIGLAAPTGLYMSFFAEGGFYASVGFLLMGFFWLLSTSLAIRYAVLKDIQAHEKWIYRSYAVSLSAVTLRLLVPALSLWTNLDVNFIIVFTAYASWLINLGITELLFLNFSLFTLKPITK